MGVWALKDHSGLFGAVLGNTPDNSDLWQAFFSPDWKYYFLPLLVKDRARGTAVAGLNLFA